MAKPRGNEPIDTDDLTDRKPDSLTKGRVGNEPAMYFDIAIYAGLALAAVVGFNTGLLRSAITILAYLVATPAAVWVMSFVAPRLGGNAVSSLLQNWVLFFGALLVIGMMLGKFARMALDETMGAEAGIGDRLAGATLGAVRVVLIATSLVLVFDQLVPADRQPAFLQGSHLRPLLSAVGQRGFSSLPPEFAATVDRLKKAQRI
jgi:membrane protein required for colicin V production